jgi:peptide/nickel transport system permease protein
MWGISLGTFALLNLIPGDPAEVILRERHETPSSQQIAALRDQMGLNDPWPIRYLHWLSKVFKNDWGVSWRTGRPVWQEITSRLEATIELALSAFILIIVISTVFGVLSAFFQNRLLDHMIRGITVFLSAIPSYWLGLLLLYFLSYKAQIFPVAGRGRLSHVILPAATLALAIAVLQGRVLRASLIQIMAMDYIRFALAKGFTFGQIFIYHMLRNALPPMVTIWAVSLGQLLGGAIIVETLFAWPGLGQLTLEAVASRDIPLIQAIVLLLALFFVSINQLAEYLHRRLDPKVGNTQ